MQIVFFGTPQFAIPSLKALIASDNKVLAVVTQFNAGAKEVTLKARGKVISRAVDAAEIVKNKFLQDVSIKSIRTSTEDMKTASGAPTKVSTIEIVLARNPGSSAELKL